MVVIKNQQEYQRITFAVGPVHTRDHGPGLFHCWRMEPVARRKEGSYRMPLSRWYQEGGSQRFPRSPGGPHVKLKI